MFFLLVFVTFFENSSILTYVNQEHWEYSHLAVGTPFHAQYGTRTTSVFLPADGKTSLLLLPSLVSLLSGGAIESENFCVLKVTGPK